LADAGERERRIEIGCASLAAPHSRHAMPRGEASRRSSGCVHAPARAPRRASMPFRTPTLILIVADVDPDRPPIIDLDRPLISIRIVR
jgi:hypothetical protein